MVSSSRQEDLAASVIQQSNPLTELDFLCNIMRPAAGLSLANMGNQYHCFSHGVLDFFLQFNAWFSESGFSFHIVEGSYCWWA